MSWKDVIRGGGGSPGLCLGARLVYNYINDLPGVVRCTVQIFADGTKIYNKYTNRGVLQQDLHALYVCSKFWQLCFSVDKCKTLHFGRDNQDYCT